MCFFCVVIYVFAVSFPMLMQEQETAKAEAGHGVSVGLDVFVNFSQQPCKAEAKTEELLGSMHCVGFWRFGPMESGT